MAMKLKCSYCNKYYDIDKPHNCEQKITKEKERNRKKSQKYSLENKNTDGYKAIHSKRWKAFRKQVILADGGYCQRCKILFNKYNYENLEVHHIIPRAIKPELAFDKDNVVTLCKSCNLEMGLNGIDFNWNPTIRNISTDHHLGGID